MHKYLFILLLVCLHVCVRGQNVPTLDSLGLPHPTQAKAIRYWFDNDANSAQSVNPTTGRHLILEVSSLMEGLHTIHFQVIDTDNTAGHVASAMFLKTGNDGQSATASAKKLLYWFDDETDIKDVDVSGNVQMVDASSLMEGLHTLHFQVLCSDGQVTPVSSSMFLRVSPDEESGTAKSLRYWFDEDPSVKEIAIGNGVHSLDASHLLGGIHTLHYQLVDNKGKVTTPISRIFMKDDNQFVENNRITKYRYWLNDNVANVQTVTIDHADNPYRLIDMLPMQEEPIRVSCFHFEVTEGVATLYAKNTFHIRFHDARGYFKDDECLFIDYRVKQEVTALEWLEPGTRTTTPRPADDEIKWYKVNAKNGDSLQFKLDRAATIQLFAPSGKEVYHVDGEESVEWGGCYAKESGTYYFALHSVTSQQGTTVSIDYDLIEADPNAIEMTECEKESDTAIYDLQGRRVEKSAIPKKGIYIVTGRRSKAQKVMKD